MAKKDTYFDSRFVKLIKKYANDGSLQPDEWIYVFDKMGIQEILKINNQELVKILKLKLSNGTTIFQHYFKKLSDIKEIQELAANDFELLTVYIQNNKISHLNNTILQDEILLCPFKNKKILDFLLTNGIIPNLNNTLNPEVIKICCNYNKYDIFVNASIETLNVNIGGESLLDLMLKNNILPHFDISLLSGTVDDIQVVLTLLKHGYYEKVIMAPMDILLYEFDTKNSLTILEFLIKNETSVVELNYELISNPFVITKLMELGAYEVAIMAPIHILLFEFEQTSHKTILEEILEKDPQSVKRLDRAKKKNPDIAYIIIKKLGTASYFSGELSKDKRSGVLTHKNIEELIWRFNGDIQVDLESEKLIQEFIEIMHTGKVSDEEIINLAVMSFKKLIAQNNPKGIQDLRRIIEIKKNNPDFTLEYNRDKGEKYFRKTISISNKYDISAFNHELSHAIYDHSPSKGVPQRFIELFDQVAMKPETWSKIAHFLKEKGEIYDIQKVTYVREFYDLINQQFGSYDKYREFLKNEFMNLSSKDFILELANMGVSDHVLKQALSFEKIDEKYVSEYVEQKIQNDLLTYCDQRFREIHQGELAIENLLDALLTGKISDLIIAYKISDIAPESRHSIDYFRSFEVIWDEIIADYAEISKSDNAEYLIGRLKDILGEDFVDFLDDYYTNTLGLNERKNK